MGFVCPHCEYHFTSKYNLKRHMERKHDSWPISPQKNEDEIENEVENSESDEEDQNDDEKFANGSQNSSSDEESDQSSKESDDIDRFTYDEVQAILRYALQEKE